MAAERSGQFLQDPRLKLALVVLALSFASLGCSVFPVEYKVPLSFSVRVANRYGPVAGLKLHLTIFKEEEFSKLSMEEQRTADPHQFEEVIAETVTDEGGEAQFHLSKPVRFDLSSDHPASAQVWVVVNVVAKAKPATVKLEWPAVSILEAKQLRGRISDGLMSSHGSPLKQEFLTLHSLVPYAEMATATTNEDGSFQFDDVAPGLYFLQVGKNGSKAPDGNAYAIRGDIAIHVGMESQRESLSIAASYSSCGLSYDLEENKARYKPVACFKGGKPVPCEY